MFGFHAIDRACSNLASSQNLSPVASQRSSHVTAIVSLRRAK
jgi:hypothetical protein